MAMKSSTHEISYSFAIPYFLIETKNILIKVEQSQMALISALK